MKPFVFCWIHTNLIIGKFNCRIFCSTRFGRVHRGGGGEFYNLVKRQNVVWHFHSEKSLTPIQRRHNASAQMFFEEVLLYLFGGSLFSIKNLNHIYFNFQVRFWFAYNSEILQIKLLWILSMPACIQDCHLENLGKGIVLVGKRFFISLPHVS